MDGWMDGKTPSLNYKNSHFQFHRLTPPFLCAHGNVHIKLGLISTTALCGRSYTWPLLCLHRSNHTSHTPSSSIFITTERKSATHTCTPTEDSNHNIVLFFLFSLFGNRRVNNFINHITWHDAPKFILFTGIHWIEHKISQWIQDWHFADCTYNSEWHFQDFLFLFFFPTVAFITLQVTSIC